MDPSDNSFCCNGIIATDRTLHPHAYEVAYQYRSIHTTAADQILNGQVNVYNENFFIDLSRYMMEWDIEVNGKKVIRGVVSDLDVNPLTTETISLGYDEAAVLKAAKVRSLADADVYLNVRYVLKNADGILEAGSQVAYDQIALNEAAMPAFDAKSGKPSLAKNDNGYVFTEDMTVETVSGVRAMHLFTRDGRVNYVEVDMGKADLRAASLPTTFEDDIILNKAIMLGGREYNITCCSIGNPHCVVFCDRVDPIDLSVVGPRFEYAEFFPDRINTEFVRVVNDTTLKVRVYERGNGETMACGTGACAAVVAACENGYCRRGDDITVKLPGGDLIVNYTEERVTLSGNTALVFKGMYQY